MKAWYLRAERTQELLESADGKGTDYYNYETFYGPVSYMIYWLVGPKLAGGLQLWMDGLKAQVAENKSATA